MHFHYDNIRLNLSMFDSENHQASSAVFVAASKATAAYETGSKTVGHSNYNFG
jgi:hypothetical protein